MMNVNARLLLIEDDERIRMELLDTLRAAGFDVDVSVLARHAKLALEREYDLVLLDLGLPDGDGLDLCRDLRAAGRNVPVIILTARDAPEERVRGLDIGADDYVVKPFNLQELVARVRSVLRRGGLSPGTGCVHYLDLFTDTNLRQARRGDSPLDLTRREFDLLSFFLRFPGRTWTRDQLLDRVWGPGYEGDARTVDLHVGRLRAKVENDPSNPKYLATVWGVGYRMGTP